ncbi:MAG: TonB-like protein [Candidatus Angelobacter sp.]|nr:TonB-like protein [Candidatus Angelobacter sp.]
MPWRNFGQSGFLHAAVIVFIIATGRFWFARPQLVVEDPYQHTTLSYYKVDDLLPAIDTAPAPAVKPKIARPLGSKAQPEYSRQEIISVPAAADNSTQTIINPPHPDILRKDVPLPNIMVAAPAPAPPTISLAKSQITLPTLAIAPIQPAADLRDLKRNSRVPDVATPIVAQPAVEADAIKRKLNEIDIAHSQVNPVVEAPKLALPEQTAAKAAPAEPEAPPPPAPSVQSLSGGPKAAGQLIALNVRPAAPAAEIKVPDASRAGIFAATPAGKVGAAGTPDIPGADSAGVSSDSAKATGAPIAITIGGPRLKPGTTAVVAGPAVLPPKTQPAEDKKRLVAAASPVSLADITRRQTPPYSPPSEERKPEDKIFGGKKYYSMSLNMPNLTSAGGSWIIRFAELNQTPQPGELSTPVATSKVDPAYPADLINDHVEGTVILYAIIHADGTVGEVRVLQGFHEKLDENARIALTRWHFRPAMKNGLPVDLEAVVQIPFKSRRAGF